MHADVQVQAERVVPPGDVLEPLLDPAVVLGVDDQLLAVVGPRVGPGGPQPEAALGGEREQPPAALALARESIFQVAPPPRDDLDLRGYELAADALAQELVLLRGALQQREARYEVERMRIEDLELLLDPDRQIRRGREQLLGALEVYAGHQVK